MGLGQIISGKLVPEPFYIVQPVNEDNSIKPLSLKESIAYILCTGYSPTNPKITLVGSGGAAKGYVGAGLIKKLHELGIEINYYRLSSVSSLVAIYEATGKDYKSFENFILGVPELIEERPLPIWAKGQLKKLGQIYTLTKPKILKTSDNGVLVTNQGLLDTTKLEHKLKELGGDIKIGDMKNLIIIASDYTAKKVVYLGKDYPDMPLHKAILIGIAMPHYMPQEEYGGHLFGDGASTFHLPLKPDLLPNDSKTILALMLRSQDEDENITDYSRASGYLKNDQRRYEINREEVTRVLIEHSAETSLEDLINNGDRKNCRIYLMKPPINGIPSSTVHIDMEKRKELIDLGYRAAEEAIKKFRRPTNGSRQIPDNALIF